MVIDLETERALYQAALAGDISRLKELIEIHPGVQNDTAIGGMTLLALAADLKNSELVSWVLQVGGKANVPRFEDGGVPITPLASAIRSGVPSIVGLLLEHGADPNFDREIISAINSKGDSLGIIKLLVEHGLDIHKTFSWPDGTIENGLSFAIAMGKQDVVDYLRSLGARMPEQPAKKPGKRGSNRTDVDQKIIDHFRKHFGKPKPLAVQQIVPTGPEVSVHVVPPSRKLRCVTLFTVGMSREPLPVRPGEEEFRFAELFMQLPPTWPHATDALENESNAWPYIWLRKLAQYAHVNQTPLGGPLTIVANDEPPQPLAEQLAFTCMMLLAEREIEEPQLGRIRLYRCLPLYTAERDFERDHDAGALMRAFDDAGVSFVHDSERKCVV